MFCDFCDKLSISLLLLDLTNHEFGSLDFPQHAYYQHQPSYSALVHSAKGGCEFCKLIWLGFQAAIIQANVNVTSEYGEGETRHEQATELEMKGDASDVKICIHADNCYSPTTVDQVQLFDVILVQVGNIEPFPSDGSDIQDFYIPPLRLALSVPLGMLSLLVVPC